MNAVLLWALPSDWTQFELLAPDVDEKVESEVRRRFDGTGVDEDEVTRLIAIQIQALHEFAQDGVVLLATRPERAAGENDPPPGLSLTLALANRPTSSPGEESVSAPEAAPAEVGAASPAARPAPTRSGPIPLVLKDPDMSAFTVEEHAEVAVAGTTLKRFQTQVFVLPKDQTGMAVVTVTTFDPDREADARKSARDFADTLCFVTADEASRDPPDIGDRAEEADMHQPKGHPPRLPEPQMLPREAADPPMEGWWVDPFPKGPFAQRYHDGTQWTAFVSYRRGGLWSDIVEMPLTDGPRA